MNENSTTNTTKSELCCLQNTHQSVQLSQPGHWQCVNTHITTAVVHVNYSKSLCVDSCHIAARNGTLSGLFGSQW